MNLMIIGGLGFWDILEQYAVVDIVLCEQTVCR